MASGVKVADRVKDLYKDMKVVKNDLDPSKRLRLVIFEICGQYIDVKKGTSEDEDQLCMFTESDMTADKDAFTWFRKHLDTKQCVYILYDCHYETKESAKEELVFLMWAPDTACVKQKMKYASSKDSIRQLMNGVKHQLEVNDLADCDERGTFAQLLGKNIIKLEGKDVK